MTAHTSEMKENLIQLFFNSLIEPLVHTHINTHSAQWHSTYIHNTYTVTQHMKNILQTHIHTPSDTSCTCAET